MRWVVQQIQNNQNKFVSRKRQKKYKQIKKETNNRIQKFRNKIV